MNKKEKIEDLKARNYSWPIPWEAVEMVAFFEDCQLKAFLCPGGKPTIGWGETENVRLGMSCTKEQADQMLYDEVCKFTKQVERECSETTTPEQLGAMVSFAYNVGIGNFKKSTVLKAHNAGNHEAAARAFSLWNKARVRGTLTELPGLTARRMAEGALYLQEKEPLYPEPFAQIPGPESSLKSSPINIAGAVGVVTGGTTVVGGALGEVMPVVNQVKELATTFSIHPTTMLGIVISVVGAVAMYWRHKQRSGGWA